MQYKWNTLKTWETWRVVMYTTAVVQVEYRISVPLVSPHPYILHNLPSGMEHPALGSWIIWTLSAGRGGLYIFNEDRKYKAWSTSPTHTQINISFALFFFSDTHWDSRIRAKLEPSGPHITWAMLTSCLLDKSGAPSEISETPSHTRYSLRSGTLGSHKVKYSTFITLHKLRLRVGYAWI